METIHNENGISVTVVPVNDENTGQVIGWQVELANALVGELLIMPHVESASGVRPPFFPNYEMALSVAYGLSAITDWTR